MPRKPKPPPKSAAAAQSRGREPPIELRIIGGSMRGRKLAYSGDPLTRPMKDRVREAVFNLVGPAAIGKHALDLFAGTGALALEALSRGAVGATMLERHFPTAELIRRNCESLGVGDRATIVPANAFVRARRELGGEGGPRTDAPWRGTIGNAAWLAFVSPPYDFFVEREQEMLALVGLLVDAAPALSIIVVEADARFDMHRLSDAAQWDVRPYPPAVVAIWRKEAGTDRDESAQQS